MSTAQAVPRKAVLRILQGLLLGTTCSLAVLIEDRRRRINALQKLLENGRKIRALPIYQGKSTERAIARALATCDADVLDLYSKSHSRKRILQPDPVFLDQAYPLPDPIQSDSEAKTATLTSTGSLSTSPLDLFPSYEENPEIVNRFSRMSLPKYFPGIDRLIARHRLAPLSRAIRGDVARPSEPEIAVTEMIRVIATVSDLLDSEDELEWTQGWEVAMRSLSRPATRSILEVSLLDNVLHLARALESAGRVVNAAEILRLVTRSEPHIHFNEPNFVERVLVGYIQQLLASATQLSENERKISIDRAVHFYIAGFSKAPPSDASVITGLGVQLIPVVVKELGMVEVAEKMLLACPVSQSGYWDLQNAFLKALLSRKAYLEAIDYFLSHYLHHPEANEPPSIVGPIVDAIFEIGGLRSGPLLEFILGAPCIPHIQSRWAVRLLESHWRHSRDFMATYRFYHRLLQHDRFLKTSSPVRRVMIQVAFDAGKNEIGTKLSEKILRRSNPTSTIRVLGTLALKEACEARWSIVLDLFHKMVEVARSCKEADSLCWDAIGRSFPRVVKVFSACHNVKEVRTFVEHCITTINVPFDKYVVTLLAKRHAQCHDVLGVISWLEFCAQQGFASSPVFLGSLLSSCRSWGYSYRGLRKLARSMSRLYPEFRPTMYGNIIRDAAAQATSMRPGPLRLAVEQVEMGNERAVNRAMVASIRRGLPQTALEIYRDIRVADDMDRTGVCLKTAIHAAILSEGGDASAALELLREAQNRGQNVSSSLIPIMTAHFDNLSPLVDMVQEANRIIRTLSHQEGVSLPPATFTIAARQLLRSGRYNHAVTFCRLAMEMEGSHAMPVNGHQFSILAEAYAMLNNVTALRELVLSNSNQPFVISHTDPIRCLRRVKHTLRLKKKASPRHVGLYDDCIQAITYSVRVIQSERTQFLNKRRLVEEEARMIVEEAAHNIMAVKSRKQVIAPTHSVSANSYEEDSEATADKSSAPRCISRTVKTRVTQSQVSRAHPGRPQYVSAGIFKQPAHLEDATHTTEAATGTG